MSAYEGELMDMDEMDDAESGYFQEVRNYDDATDHSSGSFQGSVIVPTFNSESVNLQGNGIPKAIDHSAFRAEFSTLALQGSQGFQTLDQSTEGQGRQGFQTLDQSTEGQGRQGFQTLDQSTEGPGRQGFQTLDQSTEGQGRHAHANYDVLDLQSTEGQGRHSWHAPESHGEQIVYTLTGEQVRALSALSVRESDIQLNLGKSEHTDTTHQENAAVDCKQSEPVGMSSSVNRQDLPGNQVDLPVYTMDTSSNVSFQSSDVEQTVNRTDVDTKPINIVSTGTEGSSHENRSPKRRQKKNKSSASQGSEGQKSESSRPSVSPNRGEHGSSDGQGSADLGFKPSLLEEILTEKKLALLRSPDVIQFLQSRQEQKSKEKNIVYGQLEKS